jgi:hypothetical protein
MNPQNHDDLTNELSRAMHHQADGIGGSPITLGEVKGAATRIRRRRALTASAAVAAAVAILVPTVMLNSNLFNGADGVLPSATNKPTPTTVTLGESLDVSDLKLGDAPKIAWIQNGTTMHAADGLTVALGAAYNQVVPYDDGWLALDYNGASGTEATVLNPEGSPVGAPFATGQGFALSSDGNRVLYLEGSALKVHDNGTGATTTLREGLTQDTEPIGFVGEKALYNIRVQAAGTDGRWIAPGGQEQDPRPQGEFRYLDTTDDGWASAITKVTDFGSCSESLAPHGNTVGRTCDFQFRSFSPNGENILGGGDYGDGYGDGVLAVLPRDSFNGNPPALLHYVQSLDTDATFMASRWEDDQHILVVTSTPIPGTADKMWGLVRVGLDGTVENALEPVRGDEFANLFALSAD